MHYKFLVGTIGVILMLVGGAAHATPATYPSCENPDVSFKSFLQRFTTDKAFQRSRLFLPLVARSGDGVTVEAKVELWSLASIKNLKDPLIYSDAERKKMHLVQSVDLVHQELGVAEVWQGEREGDAIKLQYWFRKHEGCWSLAEFDDWGE